MTVHARRRETWSPLAVRDLPHLTRGLTQGQALGRGWKLSLSLLLWAQFLWTLHVHSDLYMKPSRDNTCGQETARDLRDGPVSGACSLTLTVKDRHRPGAASCDPPASTRSHGPRPPPDPTTPGSRPAVSCCLVLSLEWEGFFSSAALKVRGELILRLPQSHR